MRTSFIMMIILVVSFAFVGCGSVPKVTIQLPQQMKRVEKHIPDQKTTQEIPKLHIWGHSHPKHPKATPAYNTFAGGPKKLSPEKKKKFGEILAVLKTNGDYHLQEVKAMRSYIKRQKIKLLAVEAVPSWLKSIVEGYKNGERIKRFRDGFAMNGYAKDKAEQHIIRIFSLIDGPQYYLISTMPGLDIISAEDEVALKNCQKILRKWEPAYRKFCQEHGKCVCGKTIRSFFNDYLDNDNFPVPQEKDICERSAQIPEKSRKEAVRLMNLLRDFRLAVEVRDEKIVQNLEKLSKGTPLMLIIGVKHLSGLSHRFKAKGVRFEMVRFVK